MLEKFTFDGWWSLLDLLAAGALAYLGLVILLRISGKRTLAKMNAFDLVVTVAVGSTLATTLLNRDVSVYESLVAFALLFALQYLVAWLAVRSGRFSRLIKAQPRMLYFRGQFLRDAMRAERVVEVEIRQAARSSGYASLEKVEAVVLETDGSFTVLGKATTGTQSTIRDVAGPDQRDEH
jgi:uncharacterized membrane protein YcaP (DUF421 family)